MKRWEANLERGRPRTESTLATTRVGENTTHYARLIASPLFAQTRHPTCQIQRGQARSPLTIVENCVHLGSLFLLVQESDGAKLPVQHVAREGRLQPGGDTRVSACMVNSLAWGRTHLDDVCAIQ